MKRKPKKHRLHIRFDKEVIKTLKHLDAEDHIKSMQDFIHQATLEKLQRDHNFNYLEEGGEGDVY